MYPGKHSRQKEFLETKYEYGNEYVVINEYGEHFVREVYDDKVREWVRLREPHRLSEREERDNEIKYNLVRTRGSEHSSNYHSGYSSERRRSKHDSVRHRQPSDSRFNRSKKKRITNSDPRTNREYPEEEKKFGYHVVGIRNFNKPVEYEDAGLQPHEVNYDGEALIRIKYLRKIKTSDFNAKHFKFLEKKLEGKASSLMPKDFDPEVMNIIDKKVNTYLTEFEIESNEAIKDLDEIFEFLESKGLGDKIKEFKNYLSNFVENNKENFDSGFVKIEDFYYVLNVKREELSDELDNIDTLKSLDVPENSALAEYKKHLALRTFYIRNKEKTFIYNNGKVRIYHVDLVS